MHEDQRIGKFIPLMRSLYGAARENLGFKPHAKICIVKSGNNMENPLGKTAYYSPSNHKIGLYTQGRHIKDILRSLAHELVHHDQNCRGDFEQNGETVAGYAQEDGHLREMEREAYERGNMIFRDWEDNLKDKGGKPLFTSISQYVPSPSNDVVGMPLFEQKKMKKRLNEQAGLEAAIKKQIGDDAEDAIASLHKIQAKKPKCGTYIAQLNAWARDRELKLQALSNWLPITKEKCEQERGGGAMAQDKGLTFRSSKALDAFGQLTGVSQNWRQHVAEDQKQKTNNSLVEGDKMNKKLKESQLRTIVRGLIREMVNEGDMVSDPAKSMAARAAEEEAEKAGGQPGAIYKGSLEEGGFEDMESEMGAGKARFKRAQQLGRVKTSTLSPGQKKTQKAFGKWHKDIEGKEKTHKPGPSMADVKRMRKELARRKKKKVQEDGTRGFDEGDPTLAPLTAQDDTNPFDFERDGQVGGPVFEDSKAKETYDYGEDEGADKKRLKKGDLSPEHAAALRQDMAYDEEHEDRHEAGTHFAESFLPKGRSIRQKARTELNETLMKRWTKIIK